MGAAQTNASMIGLDIAKAVFQVHGEECRGPGCRAKAAASLAVPGLFAGLPPARIRIEACGSARYRARQPAALDHGVRLIPAACVKPFMRRNKTDARDAWAFSPRA